LEVAITGALLLSVFGSGALDEVLQPDLGREGEGIEMVVFDFGERGGVGEGFHEGEGFELHTVLSFSLF
jgi:hypothetical protein